MEGEKTITYYNNSPDDLSFLWLNLEQNVNRKGNEDFGDVMGGVQDSISSLQMQYVIDLIAFTARNMHQGIDQRAFKPGHPDA